MPRHHEIENQAKSIEWEKNQRLGRKWKNIRQGILVFCALEIYKKIRDEGIENC